MTTTKIFKKCVIALTVSTIFTATSSMANPAQALAPSMAETSAKLQSQNSAETQFIIKYQHNSNDMVNISSENTDSASMNKRAQNFVKSFSSKNGKVKGKYVRAMALSNHHVVRADKKLNAEEAQEFMQELVGSGNVEYIEVDQMLQPFSTPNDPRFDDQWHYYEQAGGLNLPTAWDSATGNGVVVAVLDTGYRPHADLNANLLQGYDMISNLSVANDGGGRDSDARDPGDAVATNECGTNDAKSSSWHGTHVAGTVAAVTNNGEGVAGVAYDAKVVPVRVLGKCGGLTSDIADGIIWAAGGNVSGVPANANPADVINMSLGGSGSCSSTTQSAINAARSNGAVVVIAAGNDNDNSANYNPGNCNGVINVAAVGRNGGRAYYSNYGSNIDVAAPGGAQSFANDSEGVLSTYNTGSSSPSRDSYSYSQGTSMAAPHVAGVAALIKQAKPNATPDEIENILKSTTRSFPASCTNCGTGIVDAAAAVAAAGGTDTTKPEAGGGSVSDVNISAGQWKHYTLDVPANMSTFTVTTSGGSGDADLHVKFGSQPTASNYDCRPYEDGNEETCTFSSPQAGKWHISINAYSRVSGLTISGQYKP